MIKITIDYTLNKTMIEIPQGVIPPVANPSDTLIKPSLVEPIAEAQVATPVKKPKAKPKAKEVEAVKKIVENVKMEEAPLDSKLTAGDCIERITDAYMDGSTDIEAILKKHDVDENDVEAAPLEKLHAIVAELG